MGSEMCIRDSRLHNRQRTDRPMDRWTRRLIFDKLSFLLRVRFVPREMYPTRNFAKTTEMMEIPSTNGAKEGLMSGEHRGLAQNHTQVSREVSKCSSVDNEDAKKHGLFNQVEDHDGRYSMQEEWRIVAMTIDRCLFVIYVIVFVGGTIGCFGSTQYTT